ncbi:MAG: PEGA domain-containing protein [Candidatus Dojkabacteria bacterium]|jgi:hypothetical protein|nr:PEGA domain-containing protein [Candidatus Dojkabacteria bacterium]
MNKWKSALIIIFLVFALSLFFFFVPLDGIIKKLPLIKSFYQNTSLEITTPNGKSTVKINGKEYGETPANIQSLVSGEYEIELARTSNIEGFYKPHIFNIQLTKNSTSRINVEIGPGDNLHGVVIYYTQDNTGDSGKGKITVTSNAPDSRIYIDDEFLKNTPATNIELVNKEYKIKLKSNGYEDLEVPIIVREGYTLNIKGYMFPTPVSFETEASDE